MHLHPLVLLFVAIHAILGLWAVVGLVEWLAVGVPWPRITNPELPRTLLLVHWLAMLGTAAVFIVGFGTRWQATPEAMVAAYGVLALICAYETFAVLTNSSRFVAMTAEYVTYVVLATTLFRSDIFRAIFARG